MRKIITAVLGIILLCSGVTGRPAVFYRIRGIFFRGTAVYIMRIIYIAAGIFLIAAALTEQI